MWKDRYKVGVDLIDKQHKELFDRLGKFIRMVQNDEDYEDKIENLNETFEFLDEYTIFHFNAEEKYQENVGYPHIKEHIKEHDYLRDMIKNYKKDLEKGNMTEAKIKEISGRFMTWLINHIGIEDQKIAEYVASKENAQ